MHSSLDAQWQRMRDGKARTIERVARFSDAERGRPPVDGGWSALDVVEHLVLVEEGVTGALAKEPSPERPRILGAGGRVPFWVVRLILLTGIRRIRVPVDLVVPKGGVTWEALTGRWNDQRARLERWVTEAPEKILAAPRFKHPIGGWLDVRGALTFSADHLVNHLRQIGSIERGLR